MHVRCDDDEVKYWLNPVMMSYNVGYNSRELRVIERLVIEHQDQLLAEWHEFFNN
ncbi:MAG: DUF4160 domain-containing protein [Phycisphaera sp.]|nr:DUF4160 domain-containing protein [Phycisphaera sp.]